MNAEVNFVRQQGFSDVTEGSCDYHYPALMWQPRVIGVLVLVRLALRSSILFLLLSSVPWWYVVVPRLSLFDMSYCFPVSQPKGRPRGPPAPNPRRFSQALSAMFMLVIGGSLAY